MAKQSKEWIVKVPVTLVVCTQVSAHSKSAAIIAANEKANGLVAYYNGGESDMGRPPLVGFEDNGEDEKTWWDQDSLDATDIFLSDKAVAEPADEVEDE